MTKPLSVVRIPITGPQPFNTLAVVMTSNPGGEAFTGAGNFHFESEFPTPFVLAGNDPRRPPLYRHSTTAWQDRITSDPDMGFLAAVDEVDGHFDATGRWIIDVRKAIGSWNAAFISFPGSNAFSFNISTSSYVLVWEPPLEAGER